MKDDVKEVMLQLQLTLKALKEVPRYSVSNDFTLGEAEVKLQEAIFWVASTE